MKLYESVAHILTVRSLSSGTIPGIFRDDWLLQQTESSNIFRSICSRSHTNHENVIESHKIQNSKNFNFFGLCFSAKVNDIISILINSPTPLSYVNYLVSSRGKLVLSARKDVPNKDTFTITFPATFDMVPSAKFVAYYVLPTGEMVSTSIDVPVIGLNNFVRITNIFCTFKS